MNELPVIHGERCGIYSRFLRVPCTKPRGHSGKHRCGPGFGWVNWNTPLPSGSHSGLVTYPPLEDGDRLRWRAVRCAVFYGLVPSRLYEDTPHYAPWSYWRHLRENLALAWRWWIGREDAADWRHERSLNSTPRIHRFPQKPRDEDCERCKNTRHDWEPGPTGEPVSTGPCPDCQLEQQPNAGGEVSMER